MLAVNNLDPAQAPLVLPTHFTARRRRAADPPGPAEPGLAAPGGGRRGTAGRDRRLRLHPDVLAGQGRRPRRGRRADQLLRRRAVRVPAHRCRRPRRARRRSSPPSSPTSNPKAATPPVAVDEAPYGRMLSGIRGVRLTVLRVEAKFKYDDANPVEHRERVIGHLERARPRTRRRRRGPATAAPGRDRRLEDPPEPVMTTNGQGAGISRVAYQDDSRGS